MPFFFFFFLLRGGGGKQNWEGLDGSGRGDVDGGVGVGVGEWDGVGTLWGGVLVREGRERERGRENDGFDFWICN